MAGGDAAFLQSAAVFLGAAVVAVPLFKRLKLGSVLGYLAAGIVIGPHTFGLVPEAEQALEVANFGVVLLLFVIGLELRPEKLWRLRGEVFGLGAAQVILTAVLIGVCAYGFSAGYGMTVSEAVVVGAGLALSSTAFAIQILRERGALASRYGDRAFAILLFQDLAIVPLIGLVALLSPGLGDSGEPMWSAALKAIGAIAGLLIVGHYLLKPLFHQIAAAKADEVFTATALLVVVGAALAMEAVGLSMAMGAFIAGVLLAESPFRHQVETDIEPFRGLFMGLFFIAVGMNLDLELVADHILLIVFSGVALVIMKAVLIFLLARAAGSDRADAIRIAAVLCQGGEFGFVLFGEALNAQVMSVANAPLLNAVVTLSMAATPLAVLIGQRLATRVAPPEADEDMDGVKRIEDAPEETKGAPIIVAGFGRAGQVVAQLLRMRGYAVTLIDNNPRRIRIAESFGAEVFFGDARRLDVLATADADAAQAIFLCLNDREGARLALERIRDRFPNTKVYAMTYDRFSMMELEQAGAHHVARETFESALALASEALRDFGDGDAIEDLVEEFRRRDAQLLKSQADFGAHEGLRKLRETYSLESTDDGVERTPQRDG